MNSREYLYKLEKRLKNLPREEREEAMAYYSEVFAEAGEEESAKIIARIGSPVQVATGIKADAAAKEFESNEPKVRRGIHAVWFAVLGVFAFPIALPVGIAGFAVVLAVLIAIAAVYISLAISAIAVGVSGIATTGIGFIILPQSFATAVLYIGGGLVCIALGMLLSVGVYLLTKVTLKGIATLFNKIRYKKMYKINKKNENDERMVGNEQSM